MEETQENRIETCKAIYELMQHPLWADYSRHLGMLVREANNRVLVGSKEEFDKNVGAYRAYLHIYKLQADVRRVLGIENSKLKEKENARSD